MDQKAVRHWLKTEHGLAQNTQWTLADAAARQAGWVPPTVEQYVDALYSGTKAGLRPLHDQLDALIRSLADDVTVQGRGTYVPYIRKTQFAALAPGTYGRLRLGLRFRSAIPAVTGLDIEEARNFAQATHWVHLSPEATDTDVAACEPLLRAAYDQNG